MATWADLEGQAPELAAEGRRLLYARGHGEALLATVRGDARPRIHPISIGIVGGHLYAFLLPSPKRADLEQDGRFALHAHQDPAAPDEFQLRGQARLVTDPSERARAGDGWPFTADDTYVLFEFAIASALLGRRGADEWPPRYTSWRSAGSD